MSKTLWEQATVTAYKSRAVIDYISPANGIEKQEYADWRMALAALLADGWEPLGLATVFGALEEQRRTLYMFRRLRAAQPKARTRRVKNGNRKTNDATSD